MNIETIFTTSLLTASIALTIVIIWAHKNYNHETNKETGTADPLTDSVGEDTTGSGAGFNDLSKIDDWFPGNELTPRRFLKIKK